jgi:phage repressor protein C with HTH and peptisase S24 domain
MSTLGERIKHIRSVILKVNQAGFAGKLGFSRVATISDYEKDKRNPDIETLRKMASLGSVTLDWLLTGEGPVSVYETNVTIEAKDARQTVYSGDFVKVDVFDMAPAGEPGGFPAGDPVDTVYVPVKDHNKNIVGLRFEGDSMSPNIIDGATVGIDTSDRHLVSGRLYAVWLGYEGVTVKRVFVHPDKVVLKPDNRAFPETEIPTDVKGENFIIGRVKWVFQRF